MNLLSLTFANLRYKPLTAFFNVMLLAMGIAVILTLSHLDRQLHESMTRDLKGIDLVVSGKGSPLQIILSTIFHLDVPTGNIPAADATVLSKNPLIASAIPLALGDNFKGFRIVGTTEKYLHHYRAVFAAGVTFNKPMEAVLGSTVAAVTGARVGDRIVGAHGLTGSADLHTDAPYTVTGILAPTGLAIDRIVMTPLASVWHVHHEEDAHDHEHHHMHDEEEEKGDITALLISYKSPLAAARLPREINARGNLQAASPAFEMARLTRLMGTGSELLSAFGILLIGFSGIGLLITLNNAINERLYDIAIMRVLGATRRRIFSLILCEALVLGVAGTALGFALAYIFESLIAGHIAQTRYIDLPHSGFNRADLSIALLSLALCGAAAILPAMKAARLNLTRTLTRT